MRVSNLFTSLIFLDTSPLENGVSIALKYGNGRVSNEIYFPIYHLFRTY